MAVAPPAIPCPKCGSHRVRPSRVRSLLERIRRAVTERQPYRCHGCNYRAWYVMQHPAAGKPDHQPADLKSPKAASTPLTTADLDQLDNR